MKSYCLYSEEEVIKAIEAKHGELASYEWLDQRGGPDIHRIEARYPDGSVRVFKREELAYLMTGGETRIGAFGCGGFMAFASRFKYNAWYAQVEFDDED